MLFDLFETFQGFQSAIRQSNETKTFRDGTLHREQSLENLPKKSTILPISSVGIQSPIVVSLILDST